MKLLIFGIDAADPDIILNNRDILPNLDKLCGLGLMAGTKSCLFL